MKQNDPSKIHDERFFTILLVMAGWTGKYHYLDKDTLKFLLVLNLYLLRVASYLSKI